MFHVVARRYNGRMTDDEPGVRFAAAVAAELKTQGRSENWLQKETGVARTTLARWRKRETTPTSPPVILIADALGIDRAKALRLAGLSPDVIVSSDHEPVPLAHVDTDVLLTEIRRRIPAEEDRRPGED